MPIDLIAKKKETQSAEEQYSHEVSSLESSYKEVWQNNNIENVKKIEINKLVPFANHPFTLYEGERLEDMISSIKSNGILMPLIVREKATSYEILSGHNRVV